MQFSKGNKICYGQDFRFFRGLPSGVDFTVESRDGGKWFELRAPGYGATGAYGCGSLFVRNLTRRQRQQFEAACGENMTNATENHMNQPMTETRKNDLRSGAPLS